MESNSQPKFVLSPQEMSACEVRSAELGVSLWELMLNAGFALSDEVRKRCYKDSTTSAVILAGRGNNAGDGFVCAQQLALSGITSTVVLLCGLPKTELSRRAFSLIADNPTVIITEDFDLTDELEASPIIVDCVFGTGFHGDLPEEIANLFSQLNSLPLVKFACDIPSGINALNGYCDSNALKCDCTVTFHRAKLGEMLVPAREKCGEIIVADIKIPADAVAKDILVIDEEFTARNLPVRPTQAHKGTFGKLLCICGSRSFTGAVALSALGAMRSGVGLCTICAPKSVVNSLSSTIFEAVYLPVSEDERGFSDYTDEEIEEIVAVAKSASAVLFGCGVGQTKASRRLLEALVETCEKTLIIDADGINCLALDINILMKSRAEIVLTPHPAELARLCGCTVGEAVYDRLTHAERFARRFGVTVVAKGAGTLICAERVALSLTGNSGLARGGSGDLLAGIIASLCAQGTAPFEASCCGCYLHGYTADVTAEELSERGMLPSDLLTRLPLIFKNFGKQRQEKSL